MPLPSLDVSLMLFYACSLVFAVWPVLLLAPLQSRRGILPSMLMVWVLLAAARIYLLFFSQPHLVVLIPEPYNTLAFAAAGLIILGLFVLTRRRRLA